MGASLDTRTFESDDRKVIQSKWEAAVEDDLYENGHSYSGGVGMLGKKIGQWVDVAMPTAYLAGEYISDKHNKYHSAMAVSFVEKGKKGWVVGGWCSC